MCVKPVASLLGFDAPKQSAPAPAPAPVKQDPVAEQAKIDAEAQAKANQIAAERKRSLRNSLLSTGAGYNDDDNTLNNNNNNTFG